MELIYAIAMMVERVWSFTIFALSATFLLMTETSLSLKHVVKNLTDKCLLSIWSRIRA